MRLYYFKRPGVPNFGDELNLLLWEKLLPGIFKDENDGNLFVGIGTLLDDRIPQAARTLVFGAGVGYGDHKYPVINKRWNIYCVRGPMTADALGLEKRMVVTDSALLLRRFFQPKTSKIYKMSYMPYFLHGNDVLKELCEDLGVNYIDATWPVERIITAVNNSECLLSEAMHGAICADALRVPWIPVVTTKNILPFKWQDWCLSMDLQYQPNRLDFIPRLVPPSGGKSWFRRRLYEAKKTLIGTLIKNISRNSKRYLSRDELFERKSAEMNERLSLLQKDYQANFA